jgi:hypothetical protein
MSEKTYTLTLDQLVRFAQEGWQFPLPDTQETRDEIVHSIERVMRKEEIEKDGMTCGCGVPLDRCCPENCEHPFAREAVHGDG